MEAEKLLVVAQELRVMVDDLRDKQVGNENKEVLMKQALYGAKVSLQNAFAQIELAKKIEAMNGNMG